MVQTGQDKNHDPISKITRTGSAGNMTQAVQHLPRKYKALSSNACISKKQKTKKKEKTT
jgi:hypothetical protein